MTLHGYSADPVRKKNVDNSFFPMFVLCFDYALQFGFRIALRYVFVDFGVGITSDFHLDPF